MGHSSYFSSLWSRLLSKPRGRPESSSNNAFSHGKKHPDARGLGYSASGPQLKENKHDELEDHLVPAPYTTRRPLTKISVATSDRQPDIEQGIIQKSVHVEQTSCKNSFGEDDSIFLVEAPRRSRRW